MNETFRVYLDGKKLFIGTGDECFEFILRHQSFSVNYATTYGGYSITKIEEPKREVH